MTSYRKTLLFLTLVTFMMPGIASTERLVYEVIEDFYDDTTQIRSLTEQASVYGGKGWLIRTTIYTPLTISTDVVFVPINTNKKDLFKPVQ